MFVPQHSDRQQGKSEKNFFEGLGEFWKKVLGSPLCEEAFKGKKIFGGGRWLVGVKKFSVGGREFS